MTHANWTAPADTALIIVDAQNDFCPGGALAVDGGDEIIPVVNALRDHFNLVVLTQDKHPSGHCSFASSHDGKAPRETVEMPYGTQVLWPDHCEDGSEGVKFHKDLIVKDTDLWLEKGTHQDIDSYSGFYENDQKTQPRFANGKTLTETLNDAGITRVVLTGLAYDFCVGWHGLDAVKDGFEVVVVDDATRAIGMPTKVGQSDSKQDMDAQLAQNGVKVVSAADLPQTLGVPQP